MLHWTFAFWHRWLQVTVEFLTTSLEILCQHERQFRNYLASFPGWFLLLLSALSNSSVITLLADRISLLREPMARQRFILSKSRLPDFWGGSPSPRAKLEFGASLTRTLRNLNGGVLREEIIVVISKVDITSIILVNLLCRFSRRRRHDHVQGLFIFLAHSCLEIIVGGSDCAVRNQQWPFF